MKLKDLISKYGECEVSEEMLNMIKKDNEDWKPKSGEDYWLIDSRGSVQKDSWLGIHTDNFRLQKRNVYRTREEAQSALDMYYFCKKRSFEPDWNDERQEKFYIYFNLRDKVVVGNSYNIINNCAPFYYPTKEAIQEVIDKYTFEELEKYYGRV